MIKHVTYKLLKIEKFIYIIIKLYIMKVIGRFIDITPLGILNIATYQGKKDFTVDLKESKKQTKDIRKNDIVSVEYKNEHKFLIEKSKIPCPRCNSDETRFFSYKVTEKDGMKKSYKCKSCHKEFTI